ncbi:MAG: ribosome maturation factor RimM [Defluviitaleaceae bacterium]|nr:ribosome maturation factor RimM [Defluviitaleaceae bacterium]
MMTDYFEIGKIVNTVGIAGEIKVYPTTDDPKRFGLLETIRIMHKGEMIEKTVRNARYHKNLVMLKLEGIDDVEAAHSLRGGVIVVEREQALPLSDNEYYLQDLVGMTVVAEGGRELGILADVIFTGANDVYIVRREGAKDLLIPAISQCILSVDVSERRMVVHLLEGLES